MPAPPLSNNFEGGTNAATVTTGNSGGASGNAWTAVQIGASATFTYDNAHTRGLEAGKVLGAATPVTVYGSWTGLGSITTDVWFRKYCYLTANPSTNEDHMRAQANGGGMSAGLSINGTGKIACENAAFGTIVGTTGSVSVALNQWIRIEWRVRSSATVGQVEWRLYNTADSTTIDETKSATGLVLAANTDEAYFGMLDGNAVSYTHWQDDLAVSSTDWLGPALVPPPGLPPFSPIPFQAQGRNL